jgi:hypothetical protein
MIPAVRDFFNAALLPEARARFWDLINDDDEGIPLDTLVEIAGWLAEVYSGGPPYWRRPPAWVGGEIVWRRFSGYALSCGHVTYSRPSELTSSTT